MGFENIDVILNMDYCLLNRHPRQGVVYPGRKQGGSSLITIWSSQLWYINLKGAFVGNFKFLCFIAHKNENFEFIFHEFH